MQSSLRSFLMLALQDSKLTAFAIVVQVGDLRFQGKNWSLCIRLIIVLKFIYILEPKNSYWDYCYTFWDLQLINFRFTYHIHIYLAFALTVFLLFFHLVYRKRAHPSSFHFFSSCLALSKSWVENWVVLLLLFFLAERRHAVDVVEVDLNLEVVTDQECLLVFCDGLLLGLLQLSQLVWVYHVELIT